MSIQNLNAVRAIARLAEQTGATLPSDIAAAAAHLEVIVAATPARLDPGVLAKQVAQHLGDPAAMAKARKAAVSELVAADAATRIDSHLAELCGARAHGLIRRQATEVSAAIGARLAPDLAVLNDHAADLPVYFQPDQAETLDPAAFASWVRLRDAYARVTATHGALQPLYRAAVDDRDGVFTLTAIAALRFTEPPVFDSSDDAYSFAAHLEGTAVRGMGTASQGSPWVHELFVPTLLAHAGATFTWATPDQVTDRAARITTAMVAATVAVS